MDTATVFTSGTGKLAQLLEHHFNRINTPEFIDNDPVKFPRRYHDLRDIEIAGILCSTIAWGRRTMILGSCERMLGSMGGSPYDYVMSADLDSLPEEGKAVHRTFSRRDLKFFLRALRRIYSRHDTLEELFSPRPGEDGLWDGIARFRAEMLSCEHHQEGERHISCPEKGSACKRLHLFLRWMVRRDGIVDLGVWKNIKPSQLSIPLDVHVGNMARMLGILNRNQNDRRAVQQIDAFLRRLDPEDPAKYDYALFGLGESGYFENNLRATNEL